MSPIPASALAPITESSIPGLVLGYRGKVRDVYDLGDRLLIVATDRLSAFDVVLPTAIPGKGWILTQLSNFWFEQTAQLLPNHLLSTSVADVVRDAETARLLEGRAVVTRKAEPLRIEAVVRGYLAGGGWSEYQRTGRVSGVALPPGLRESDRLPEPIFTPSTKAPKGQHDEPISFDEAAAIIGGARAEAVRDASLRLYRFAAERAAERGLLLADTKFEFGLVGDDLIFIDEALTPDSSRYWDAAEWAPGRSQPSFDKQIVRDWLLDSGWDKQPPGPELPPEVAQRTADRYYEAFRRLTGRDG